MRAILRIVALAGLLIPTLVVGDVAMHAFDDPSNWKPNNDGGNPPATRADRELNQYGPALRLVYRDREPHWGNLTAPCTVPAEARALTFRVYRHAARPSAAMHIWLFEPDGDAWVSPVTFNSKTLADAPAGWNLVRIPLGAFRFDGRGAKTRQIGTVNRILIGCNFADLEVTVADMTWETGPALQPVPLPRTDNLQIEDGPQGRVGVLDLGVLPAGYKPAHEAGTLAAAARRLGYGATMLKPGDLADKQVLTREHFDAVLLPWGPWFPEQARESFTAYLKSGGSFLTLDGYSFDNLAELCAEGWLMAGKEATAAELDKATEKAPAMPMNTRTGKSGDAMTFAPEQIGLFDPGFLIREGQDLQVTAEWQGRQAQAETERWHLKTKNPGYAAVGLIGVNSPVFPDVYRRYVPVVNAYADPDGGTQSGRTQTSAAPQDGPENGEAAGLRGPVLGVMHNFSGVYRGSSWGFSGLTDGTQLLLGSPGRERLLGEILREITAKVYLHSVAAEQACYEPGETAKVLFSASNYGRTPAVRTYGVRVEGHDVGKGELTLQPGETKVTAVTVPCSTFATDYCRLRVTLATDGGPRDELTNAFCIRSPQVIASGPRVAWKDNYLSVDGRPTFMVGSNQTGMMYYSPHEGPEVWDRDFANMAAHNFHILRILHFSPFCKGGYEGRPTDAALDLVNRPEKLVRQMDAIVQLAQKHRVAIFLSLHDWLGVGLTPEELAAEADWCRFWAGRYKDVPGIFYDIQNEPSVDVPDRPDVVALWNDFLRARYGNDEALRAAWYKSPPEKALPNVPLGKATDAWDDVRAADRKRFEAEVLNRWVKANVEGIRAGDPDAVICVGYLPSMSPADKMLGTRYTDFSNMHYYGGIDGFTGEFALIDRRLAGKGLTLGECGAQEDHGRRNAGGDGLATADSIYRFQTYAHYGPMMGAAFLANWCWKDFDEAVFPWGLMPLEADVPKPWTHTWQQESLLVSLLQPQWQVPPVAILAPDRHRMGAHYNEIHSGLRRCVDLLLDRRVNFAMTNEEDLGAVPAGVKALLWPLPYCPDDTTFDRVLAWVKQGGTLYLSGTVAFDADRKPTRLSRLAALGLPEIAPEEPFAVSEGAWEQKPLQAACGKGHVVYVPYPLELREHDSDAGVYAQVLERAGVDPVAVLPAEAPVRVMSLPVKDGGVLYMLARRGGGPAEARPLRAGGNGGGPASSRPLRGDGNGGEERDLLTVTLPAAKTEVQLAPQGFAFVRVGPKGEVLAAESQGTIRVDGKAVAAAEGHYGVCSLDGSDLRSSKRLLVLPHQCANVKVLRPVSGLSANVARPGYPQESKGAPVAAEEIVFPAGCAGQVAVVAPRAELAQAWKTVHDAMALRFGGK